VLQEQASPEMAKPMPWEVWSPFKDLEGQDLRDRAIILGDELQQRGKRRAALDAYLKAASGDLLPREKEAATIRIASQYLALDDAKKSLSTIGAFYKRRGLGEANVDVPFGLVLGFAYGRSGDIDQSFAWFSKVATQGRVDGPAIQVAKTGLSMLLRTLPAEDFERVAVNWRGDTFINEHIGRERLRRASPGYVAESFDSSRPFWIGFSEVQLSPTASMGQGIGGSPVVGVILSLSNRFGALGRDTKQGFELAIDANNTIEPKVKLEARDVGADVAAASAAIRELKTSAGATVIAGPLLTEPAVAAADAAKAVGVPLLSFSKSESFATGGGVFRLGATTTSQIDAIVNAAYGDYKMTRFAIAYPQSASGTEFLEAFKKKLAVLGLSLELQLAYVSSDEASMLEVAQQLESSTAEAVLIPDSIDTSAKLLTNLSPAVRRRMRPLGTALWDNVPKIARSQALFEKAIFVTPFFAQSTRSEVQKFVESYRAKFNSTPNFLAAQGFDAGTLIMSALRKGLAEGTSFDRAFLALPSYAGVTGVMSVLPSGEVARSFYVVEVMRDSFQEKFPVANPARYDGVTPLRSDSRSAQSPLLGTGEKVESGY
jgi:branched-chain amino acid transport system substrate-binding protein